MKQLLFALLFGAAVIPSWASNPGEPMDCSDWVFLEPGLSCAVWSPCGDPFPEPPHTWCNTINDYAHPLILDNDGRLYRMTVESLPPEGMCTNLKKYTLHRRGPSSAAMVAEIASRCVDPAIGTTDVVALNNMRMMFDEERGRIILFMESRCNVGGTGCTDSYDDVANTVALEGFTTTFEILQTYEPTTDEIGFRVPYMPEGFQYADYFDTYWGDLATVGDWSQAQPLQCGYPATLPSTGDYLTVADTLPPLQAGQGRYYVTAAHHQGQIRYGRKSSGGILSGRDPALLPACREEELHVRLHVLPFRSP